MDKNRLYSTGPSMGCLASIALLIKSAMFAAALLVAGQWAAAKMSVLTKANMWIIVSERDRRAMPGMNASLAALEATGAKIGRATCDGRASVARQATNDSQMIAEGNTIKYAVFKKGTVYPEGVPDHGGTNHIYTWSIAYAIEGVRDWLFTQAGATS